MTDDELDDAVKTTTVFARVTPADKLRIIQSLKRTGEVAAMATCAYWIGASTVSYTHLDVYKRQALAIE